MNKSILIYSSLLLNVCFVLLYTQVDWEDYIADFMLVQPLLIENAELRHQNDSLILNGLGVHVKKHMTRSGIKHEIYNFANYCIDSEEREVGQLFYAVRRAMGLNREEELLEIILRYEKRMFDKKT